MAAYVPAYHGSDSESSSTSTSSSDRDYRMRPTAPPSRTPYATPVIGGTRVLGSSVQRHMNALSSGERESDQDIFAVNGVSQRDIFSRSSLLREQAEYAKLEGNAAYERDDFSWV